MSERVGMVRLESSVRRAPTGSRLHSSLVHHSISAKIRDFSMSGWVKSTMKWLRGSKHLTRRSKLFRPSASTGRPCQGAA